MSNEQSQVRTPFHDRLLAGTVYDAGPMMEHPSPSFASLELLPLGEMLAPEHPRGGKSGEFCWHCAPNRRWIWRDELWHLTSEHSGMPYFGMLVPNTHVLLDDAPVEVLAGLGELLQRVSRAVKKIDAVARLHYARFNDGGEHWHQQLVARPLGMMQARGTMSYLWADTLPEIPEEMWRENSRIVAAAMAEDGGEDLSLGWE